VEINFVLGDEGPKLKSHSRRGIMEELCIRFGCLIALDLVVVEPLITFIYVIGMLVSSTYICLISGILHKNVILVEGLEYCDGGFSSYNGLSLIINSYPSYHLAHLLYPFISGFVSIGTYGAVNLGSRICFRLLHGSY